MSRFDQLEVQRLESQSAQDSAKQQGARNRLGQFPTPPRLAADIIQSALALLPSDYSIRFFDPAFGTGAFYSALLRQVPVSRIEAAAGYEIDRDYAATTENLWRNTGLRCELKDFTKIRPPPIHGRFNFLICNPPYVRHHHLSGTDKARLHQASKRAAGIHLSGLAGLYCHFLALAHPWMSEQALAVWLVPSEFMNVNYGKAIRDYLLNRVTLLRIHRFDPNDVQFSDALVSSAVVFFRNVPPPNVENVEFTFGTNLLSPTDRASISADDLRHESKWTRFPRAGVRETHIGPTLDDLFVIKRGLATGANDVFILNPDQIAKRNLPNLFLRPILPSPRSLETNEVMADSEGNPILNQPKFLLDCRLPQEQVADLHPSLNRYLEEKKSEVAERYLCARRSPWYLQENRPPAPILCTYIGRSDTKNGRPFRFILNHSKATAPNVYLMLYPKTKLRLAIDKQPTLQREIWQRLGNICTQVMLGESRVYGGGLHKMEPRELANVPATGIIDLLAPLVGARSFDVDLFTGRVLREEPTEGIGNRLRPAVE
jgi:adenine-specific DNA-methyltransferase